MEGNLKVLYSLNRKNLTKLCRQLTYKPIHVKMCIDFYYHRTPIKELVDKYNLSEQTLRNYKYLKAKELLNVID